MSCDDGLVMTLHPGVRRNHHGHHAAVRRRTPGNDIPIAGRVHRCAAAAAGALRHAPGLPPGAVHPGRDRLLPRARPAGRVLPAVYVGAPGGSWTPRTRSGAFRAAVTETAGFSRTSGFIDDTRAFCSIPARHDMSRRIDAGFLAGLVAEHRLDEDEALDSRDRPGRRRSPERCSSCDRVDRRRAAPAPPEVTPARPRPCGSCISAWATSSAPTRPGTPTTPRTPTEWGIAAFTGRSADLADALTAQDGLYTLITRAAGRRPFEVLGSLSRAHPAADHAGLAGLPGRPRPSRSSP